jgi:hypothetical protein
MANVDAPFGMQPIRHKSGAPYNGSANPYYIPASYGTALFVWDPVIKTGTSNTTEQEGYQAGTLPEINKATAGDGNSLTGVIVGFGVDPSNLSTQYNPASTERIAWVADDPDLVFRIQDDGSAALDATSVGLNANLIFTASGSTVTGKSGAELDATTPAADASNQLTIQRLHYILDNELGVNAVWEVKINQHTEVTGVIGI